jgi:RNA polymerase sigma-70 factor (ECF subfamily)
MMKSDDECPAGVVAIRASQEISLAVIERARTGDEEAFHLIFNRYGRPVMGFIHNLVHNRELTEELTQETFVRAHRHLPALKDDLHFSTWLFGIARNVVRESARQVRRDERQTGLDEPESLNLQSTDPLPEGAMLNRELQQTIQHALRELDDDKRLVFSLKIFQEKSYEEISAITGYSIGKLKTDLHRARAEMRRRLSPYLLSEH